SKLSRNQRIIGIKEASGNLDTLEQIKKNSQKGFCLLSGDDSSCMDFMNRGGHGVISVVSHVIPAAMVEIAEQCRNQDQQGLARYKRYDELNKLMGIESNPIPVKMALYLMGIIDSPELRLPLMTLESVHRVK